MLFNSIDFAVFLPIVFILYWFVFNKRLQNQNLLIAVVSYIFYGWWDWRFLSLILFSSVVDFTIGLKLLGEKNEFKRKVYLWCSIVINLGFLGFFKYYNFFLENFNNAFSFFGQKMEINTLSIVLPVGISFYTFQTLSYTIDVYKQKLKPINNFIVFSAFVSFFPQLVAGPIERATNLLPQFYKKRKFNYDLAVDGLRQILWGLFKKVVIADNCAYIANEIFNNSADYNGSSLLVGALFFTFQIYGDFSGYSDIAIGVSKLFGFNLMQNFAFPYFSRDIAEFWRRWHISLSTWFRDYVYIPLGGSRGSKLNQVRNVFIIFIVSGFWHGANWTFIIWGALNALYFLPLLLLNKNRSNTNVIAKNSFFPSIKELVRMLFTFGLTVIAWVFFRAENVTHAILYLKEVFSPSLINIPDFPNRGNAVIVLFLLFFLLVVEWFGRKEKFALEQIYLRIENRILRWGFYSLVISIICIYMKTNGSDFIYFQF